MADEDQQGNGQEVPEFVFDTWTVEVGLSRKAVAILRQEDLTQKQILVLLSPGDVRSLNLQLGQRKLLEAALEQLKPKPVEVAAAAAAAPTIPEDGPAAADDTNVTIRDIRKEAGADVGKCLHDLLAETDISVANKSAISRPSAECDPRSILTVKATNSKAVHILQFLPERARKRRQGRRREFVLASGEEQIVLRPEEDHPYSGITIAEWGAANAKVMNHLLQNCILARSDVEYYLAYTAKVFELATKYEWDSVLEYD